jgi:MFS family permease
MLMKLQPLKNINFLSLYLNQICSILGDNIYRIVLIYLTYSIGGAKSLGIVFGAQAFTIFLTVLFAGSLTSFFRSKIILLISICLRGILSLLLIGVNIFKLNSVIIFLALGIIFGISESLYRPSYQELFKSNAEKEFYEESLSLITISRQTINIVGPMIGASILELTNPNISLLTTFIIFLVSVDLRQVFGHKKIKFFCTTTIHGLFHVPSRLSK